ncbi:MAG TPA: hypothetical protein DCE41_00405 [Cytophagales bacterium]|nr:hypothetical protein [Cytophagales bacterium]
MIVFIVGKELFFGLKYKTTHCIHMSWIIDCFRFSSLYLFTTGVLLPISRYGSIEYVLYRTEGGKQGSLRKLRD